MFKKAIKIKSNSQVKGSERKSIRELILKNFPNLTETEANEIFNKKEAFNCVKLVNSDNETIVVYTIQKRPMFFDIQGRIFPTIFLLWKFPCLTYSFTIHPQVMNFISSGADLMLPGVLTPPLQSGISRYGSLSQGDIAYINLSNNKSAIAVGITAQSSMSMEKSHGRGKCISVYHVYGDKLCTLEGLPNLPIPNMGSPEWLTFKSYDEDFPELNAEIKPQTVNETETENIEDNIDTNVSQSEAEDNGEDMDELLWYCFLGALKYSKTLILPVLVSNFYKIHMLPICPSNKILDIKKTSYKKLKPFLDSACEQGLISVNEIKKGVEAITTINKDHPKISEFYMGVDQRPKTEKEVVKQTNVTESYIVTQNVLPIFQSEGYNKGDVIEGPSVRKCVTKYVKENDCQDENNSKLVKPKDVLKTVCKTENLVTWEELMEKVCESMKSCYKVTSGEDQFLNKGKISPITMSVSVRSGNKKVTLVDNLELFGINIPEFAKECQHGVAASTSITIKPPGKKSDQLLVQGNQVVFIHNLLSEKYRIPKKYIKGLENAPKKKK